ncbi:hypothetical protein Cgig2_009745 [Carnegiea gigantea]|uniref:Uncharacterized protein n=1 Tax=Carnegiea gigantea TaxID=171969 RepID=A0A9Q1Q7Y9_9CARY|nr:hypothetical protein Cgig2_009745 [Carnegiea gigantea]
MESRNWTNLTHIGYGEFDVVDGHTNFIIRLASMFCDYQNWQLVGISYKYIVRCTIMMKEKLEDYCGDCITTDKYKKFYNRICPYFALMTRIKTYKKLGHNVATYGRSGDEFKRLLEKRKSKGRGGHPKSYNRPRKIPLTISMTPPTQGSQTLERSDKVFFFFFFLAVHSYQLLPYLTEPKIVYIRGKQSVPLGCNFFFPKTGNL